MIFLGEIAMVETGRMNSLHIDAIGLLSKQRRMVQGKPGLRWVSVGI